MSSAKLPDRTLASMAVVSSPNSKASVSAPTNDKKRKKLGNSVEVEEVSEADGKTDVSNSQPKKRNSNPGVRVIRGRVYDSENGTTCHQCRQKTYAVYASCKNKSKTKPCPLKYCNTCLLNRYGEKVEDVVLLDEWSCPKCRDACNCSICRKKRGYEPTGMLTQMAKAGGFGSVSNLLEVKGHVSNYKRVKETCASPRKKVASEEGLVITSPKKKGKENLFDGKTDSNTNPSLPVTSPVDEKPKKSNQKKLKPEESKEIIVENGSSDQIKPKKSNQKKLKPEESKEIIVENVSNDPIKPKKSNQKKLKPEESKEIIVESGNNDPINPKKSNQKKLKPEESKEMTVENEIKPKKVTQKKLKPEGSTEMTVGNENIDAIKPKKVNQKKLKPEGSMEVSVKNGNGDANKPKKITQKKVKLEGSKKIVLENGSNAAIKPKKTSQKKLKLEGSNEMSMEIGNDGADLKVNGGQNQKKQKGTKKSIQDKSEGEEKNTVDENGKVLHGNVEKKGLKLSNNSFESVVSLPTGSELVSIAGIDIPKEDIGNALQLLEFCATFGKILDVKKGQPEAVLRDLIKVRSTRRGKCSVAIQFHIQLLSFLQLESELESESESPSSKPTLANDSWLKGLKSCIPKSYLSDKIDCIDGKTGAYDNLDSSTKLRLLMFLCDEVLGTEKIRNWMDDEKVKFDEKKKEARSKLSEAREKEKSVKQKMQDDIAKEIIKREGAPLTLIEHDAILSKIRKEAAEAHAEMLACKQMVPIDKERPDAVRTEPIFRDNNGHFYWRLKGCSDKPGILLQDIGTGDLSVETVDKWSEYDDEQMALVEKHINIMRSRIRKGNKNQV